MEKLSFSLMQLIQEEQQQGERFIFPNRASFNSLGDRFNITIEETYYEIVVEKSDDFIWFSFDFNRADPRDESLTNITNGNKRPNNRSDEEVELIHQVFFLYHYSKQVLYTSNSKKKSLIEKVLKERLQKNFFAKALYKNFNEFVGVLKQCSKVSFTHSANIFSRDNKKRQALVDLTGTNAPENFTIEAKYSKHRIENFLRDLHLEKQNNELDALMICGIDESDFTITYNSDSFSKKVDIECEKDANGKFICANVKDSLIANITTNERN